jgi:hypothetical protein
MKSILNKTKTKYKIQNTKYKKSLKSVKRIQKGGVEDGEVFGTIHKKTGIDLNETFPKLIELINLFSREPLQIKLKKDKTPIDFWSYESQIKPTQDFEDILINPWKWYNEKNPEFKILKRPTEEEIPNLKFISSDDMYVSEQIKVKEYRFIVAQIIKDLLFALYSMRMPQLHENNTVGKETALNLPNLQLNNNSNPKSIAMKKKIIEILEKIEQNIVEDFKYIKFIEYLYDYINIFSRINFDTNNNNSYNTNSCMKYLKMLKQLLFTPFIILPTLIQINYTKVLNLMKAPLLNFRLINNRKKIHNFFGEPCEELQHDIGAHTVLSHSIYMYMYGNRMISLANSNEKKKDLTYNLSVFLDRYKKINYVLNKIKKLYNYTSINTKEYYYAIFLFQFLHEITGINIIANDILLERVIRDQQKILTIINKSGENIKIKNSAGNLVDLSIEQLYDQFIIDLETELSIPDPIPAPRPRQKKLQLLPDGIPQSA